MWRPVLAAMGLCLSATVAAAQPQTTIFVEFTADGQCSIAVRSDATPSRAEMSYRPQRRAAAPSLPYGTKGP